MTFPTDSTSKLTGGNGAQRNCRTMKRLLRCGSSCSLWLVTLRFCLAGHHRVREKIGGEFVEKFCRAEGQRNRPGCLALRPVFAFKFADRVPDDVEKYRAVMGCASISEGGLRFARVRVAEPPDLGVLVNAESFKVTVAFHFTGAHDTTHAPEALFDRQHRGDGSGCLAFGVFPVRLNVALPCAVQVGKRNKPALKTLPAPEPFHEDADKKQVGGNYLRDGPHEVEKALHVQPAGRGNAEPDQAGEHQEDEEKRLEVQILHACPRVQHDSMR